MLLEEYISPPCCLQTMLLRRTKTSTIDGQPVVNLPARETGLVKKEFDEEERQFYKDLESESQEKVLVGVWALAGTCIGQQQVISAWRASSFAEKVLVCSSRQCFRGQAAGCVFVTGRQARARIPQNSWGGSAGAQGQLGGLHPCQKLRASSQDKSR